MVEAIILICAIIIAYVCLVAIFAAAIDSGGNPRHKSFWWIFFFGIAGAVIATLLNIRDK